jgi:hypothetical protein
MIKNISLAISLIGAMQAWGAGLNSQPGSARMPQGGGVAYPSWTANYYSNPDLSGEPVWTKLENRIWFDWEDWRPVIGIQAESVRNFPTDRFSVRFASTLIARFSETYTLFLTSDEKAKLRIRPEGGEWQTLIDAWQPHARRTDSAPFAFEAGKRYEVELAYADLTGDAVCTLEWAAPSVPREVVDYLSDSVVHFPCPYFVGDLYLWVSDGSADDASLGGEIKVDENGWPMEDVSWILLKGYPIYPGRYLIKFEGQANVSVDKGTLFTLDGKSLGKSSAKPAGYNPAANETRLYWNVQEKSTCRVSLSQTQRTPDSPNGSGFTHMAITAPLLDTPERNHPQEPGMISSPAYRKYMEPMFAFRVQRTGLNNIVKWEDRTPGNYPRINGKKYGADYSYEKLVLIANEMGRDLYLNYGGSIDEEFMRNIHLTIKYGTDGVNPYAGPTPNPVFPPLNPNLRLYLEHGNEMGWSAIQPLDWKKDWEKIWASKAGPAYEACTLNGKLADQGSFINQMHYHGYRTARMSLIAREVWGDDAMMRKVRPLLLGQYDNWYQSGVVQWMNDWYNNGAGDFVKNPMPVTDIVYGTGPAVYYGASSLWAEGGPQYLKDDSFEGYPTQDGQILPAPPSGEWTFAGRSGIINMHQSLAHLVTGMKAADQTKIVDSGDYGFAFTPARDLYIAQLGLWSPETGEANGRMKLIDVKTGAIVEVKDLPIKGKPNEKGFVNSPICLDRWQYDTKAHRIGYVKLEAGRQYALLRTFKKGDSFYGPNSGIQVDSSLRIDGPIHVLDKTKPQPWLPGKVDFTAVPDQGYPVGGLVASIPTRMGDLELAPVNLDLDPNRQQGGGRKADANQAMPRNAWSGSNMAFIAGKGSLSQQVEIKKTGEYFLILTGHAQEDGKQNPVTITLGDQVLLEKQTINPKGRSRKADAAVHTYGTYYRTIPAGTHTLTIQGLGKEDQILFIDALHLATIDHYYGGPAAPNFLGAGSATGQTDSKFSRNAKFCTGMSQIWGMAAICYEGGYNAGGDWNGMGVHFPDQAKYSHPYAKTADMNWAAEWHKYGGFNVMYYYEAVPYEDMDESERHMPWLGAKARAQQFNFEPAATWEDGNEGFVLPAAVTTRDHHYTGSVGSSHKGWEHPFPHRGEHKGYSPKITAGQWNSWVFRTTKAGPVTAILKTSGQGKIRLSFNESLASVVGSAGGVIETKIDLPKGISSVKVLCLEGDVAIESVELK